MDLKQHLVGIPFAKIAFRCKISCVVDMHCTENRELKAEQMTNANKNIANFTLV